MMITSQYYSDDALSRVDCVYVCCSDLVRLLLLAVTWAEGNLAGPIVVGAS